MDKIKYKILVMSGKGGVGKTTIAVNLAYTLSQKGLKVGLLDIDLHGPNVPKMLGIEEKKLSSRGDKIIPIRISDNLSVISLAFLLNKEDAVIWRGPMKHNAIKQFISDVDWDELDYLVIDFPPGTGDEAISVSQLLKGNMGSILVSTPQEVALLDLVKSIDFSKKVNVPVIGLIENMSGDIFGKDKVKELSAEKGINFLGTLELDKEIIKSCDKGEPFVRSNTNNTINFRKIVDKITDNYQKNIKVKKHEVKR